MTEETENLVLVQLHDIRVKLESVDGLCARIEAHIDKMDKGFETLRFQLTHTFGMAGMANTQALRADEKADDAITLHRRTDERLNDVERRVHVLEAAQKPS
jgi:hypothetical protein